MTDTAVDTEKGSLGPDVSRTGTGSGIGSSELESQPAPPIVYKRPKGIIGIYTSTLFQTGMLGFVCFMCPGLFNALNGLGGGGMLSATTSANANSALYATFAFFAFFAGSINNVLGSKITLQIGSCGYALYVGSYLCYNMHPQAGGFVIAAGAILGICAGLLWTAQGSLMMGYATEAQKGRYISVFWTIFNLGSCVGSAVALGQNFHSELGSVGNGTYIGFLVLTCIGVLLPMLMIPPSRIIRSDGTKVALPVNPSWKTEIFGLWIALRNDPYILLLFPMFFTSNWFYTYQFNDYNGALFNIRTRALNNLIFWLSQIVGAISTGLLLDQQGIRRRIRAFTGWCVLFGMIFVVHIWMYFYQRKYTRADVASPDFKTIDFNDHNYPPRIWLYIFCGIFDSMWQTTAYWMMGAMSNNPAKLAHFAGFYKSLQSAGAAGVWRADAVGTPFMSIFISTWCLLVAGLIFALPMIYMRVQDHTDEPEEEQQAEVTDSSQELGLELEKEKSHASHTE